MSFQVQFRLVYFVLLNAVIFCSSSGLASPTPHPSSFDDAGQSLIDYSLSIADEAIVSCDQLKQTSYTGFSITSALSAANGSGDNSICIVAGRVAPEIDFIVYLPLPWNGRFYMHGNGGYAGESLDDEVGHRARLKAAGLGFVSAFSNGGHDAEKNKDGTWGYNNRQKETDFAYRAVHETTLAAKKLTHAFYGQNAKYSYFDGCSTGGLQGFNSAQRYPDDFDGILAGAPVFSLREMVWEYWRNHQAFNKNPLSRKKLALLGATILNKYDLVDGVEDGVISDPLAIDFSPSRDLPLETESGEGFTASEIDTLEVIYSPTELAEQRAYPGTPIGGEFPGSVYDNHMQVSGSESAWEGRLVPNLQGFVEQPLILQSWFRYLAFEQDDPERDWTKLNPTDDYPETEQSGRIFNADNPNLEAFRKNGAKIMIYHGWADFGINPIRTIEYVNEVTKHSGDKTSDFLRLFLVPGMHHCKGGANVDRFDLMTPLINWVEGEDDPENLVGHRLEDGMITRSRPLCAYPETERYRGSGSINHHENFECVLPEISPTGLD